MNPNSPLFIDLDGTLIKTDLLFELFFKFIKISPVNVLYVVVWLFKGKSYLKYMLSKSVSIDVETLPYNNIIIGFIKKEKLSGRKIYLATASYKDVATSIANHLSLFDGVIASDANTNMKGENKLKRCLSISSSFAYAGNDLVDFKIFKHTEESYLVNPSLFARIKAFFHPVTYTFDDDLNSYNILFRALRVHQWLKNTLIFVPIFVSAQYFDRLAWVDSIIGFLLFSILASATYLLNDIFDLESDRKHPRKKFRPIPSGALQIPHALLIVFLCLTVVIVGALEFTNPAFQITILAYLLLTLLYTFVLKNYVIADVISLASLFTIRIIAGAMVINIQLSFWLLAFSMFTFFSLALVKRCAELKLMSIENKRKATGRDYNVDDYSLMQSFGVTSSFISLLLVAFYVQVAMESEDYSYPILLWAILPAFAYWFCRMWLKTNRGEMHDDPIVFSIKNRGSLVTIVFIVTITLVAKLA